MAEDSEKDATNISQLIKDIKDKRNDEAESPLSSTKATNMTTTRKETEVSNIETKDSDRKKSSRKEKKTKKKKTKKIKKSNPRMKRKKKKRKDKFESDNFLMRLEGVPLCALVFVLAIHFFLAVLLFMTFGVLTMFDFKATSGLRFDLTWSRSVEEMLERKFGDKSSTPTRN